MQPNQPQDQSQPAPNSGDWSYDQNQTQGQQADQQTQDSGPAAQVQNEQNLQSAPDRVEGAQPPQPDNQPNTGTAGDESVADQSQSGGDVTGTQTATENPGGTSGDVSDQTGRTEQESGGVATQPGDVSGQHQV